MRNALGIPHRLTPLDLAAYQQDDDDNEQDDYKRPAADVHCEDPPIRAAPSLPQLNSARITVARLRCSAGLDSRTMKDSLLTGSIVAIAVLLGTM